MTTKEITAYQPQFEAVERAYAAVSDHNTEAQELIDEIKRLFAPHSSARTSDTSK